MFDFRQGALPLSDLIKDVPPALAYACDLAFMAAFDTFDYDGSCVPTSHALAEYLRRLGREPTLVRPMVSIVAKCHCTPERLEQMYAEVEAQSHAHGWPATWRMTRTGTCNGRVCRGASFNGDGARSNVCGHLIVTCDGYLLDPTIGQINNDAVHLDPLVLPLPADWDARGSVKFLDPEGTWVQYSRYWRQSGFKSRKDARKSYWMPVLNRMLELELDISQSAGWALWWPMLDNVT